MNQKEYIIEFENITEEKAGKYANELRNFILQEIPKNIEVEKKRDDSDAQDFGATLLISIFTIALAKGVAEGAGEEIGKKLGKVIFEWLENRNEVKLTIKTTKDEILLENITHKDEEYKIEEVFVDIYNP